MTDLQQEAGNNPEETDTGSASATPQRKERKSRASTPKEPKLYPQWNEDGTPLLGEDGLQVQGPTKMKKPKEVKKYPVLDAEGNPVLDEEGNPTYTTVKPTKSRARVDADGNPLPRRSNVYLDSQVIRHTEKACTFAPRNDSKRGQMFAAAKDGKTVGEFYEEMGGKAVAHTFLVWFVNEAQVLEIEAPVSDAA